MIIVSKFFYKHLLDCIRRDGNMDHFISAREAIRICKYNKITKQKDKRHKGRYHTIGMWDENRKVKVVWIEHSWGSMIITAYNVHY